MIHEKHRNALPNGSFTTVIYATRLTVDSVLVLQATAARPPYASLLFDSIGSGCILTVCARLRDGAGIRRKAVGIIESPTDNPPRSDAEHLWVKAR